MESLFIVKNLSEPNKTFFEDEKLPPLPLPKLDDTIGKYLDTCRAVLTEAELERTKSITEKFKSQEGLKLHCLLDEKAEAERNWLQDWWLNMYLEDRSSMVYRNFFGFGDLTDIWPLKSGTQLERSSLLLYTIMKFWSLLRQGTLIQHKSASGQSFSMQQFRNLFNTCRIPQPKCDRLDKGFKTVSEGDCSSHIIVIYRKRIYKLQALDPKGELYTPPHFYKMLSQIKSSSEEGDGVPALTALTRDTWSEGRTHLRSISAENDKNLSDIEGALMCFVLTDVHVKDVSELLALGKGEGIPGNRWWDKSINYMMSSNGAFALCCDHSPFDGMVFVTMVDHSASVLYDLKGKWNAPEKLDDIKTEPVSELHFQLDDMLKSWIHEGINIERKYVEAVDVRLMTIDGIGKSSLKKLKIHPTAFVQICLQLAYMRKYGKPAPTYETATTRAFYNGRTETCRTCTPEVVEFCRAMIDDSPQKTSLFVKAFKKYMWLMEECKSARGIDRHLMGLALTAAENGEELPDIYKDPSFIKSGGNGNFTLSTSCTGYSRSIGCVPPMKEDGYGIFYRINNHKLSFTLSAWNACTDTYTASMGEYIKSAINDVYALVNQHSALL